MRFRETTKEPTSSLFRVKMTTKVTTITVRVVEAEKTPKQDITWVCAECKNEWSKKSDALACCGPTPTCDRCGRDGHLRSECYAQTHDNGERLTQAGSRGACYRCGRTGHYANACYASRHKRGYDLDE
jgi:hypothetical protein